MEKKSNPYGLKLIESCIGCPVSKEPTAFCKFTWPLLEKLDPIGRFIVYPKGVALFWKGQMPQGLFVLDLGRVKVYAAAHNCRSMISRIARGGDALGLDAVLLNQPYVMSAETLESVQVKFILRADLRAFMQTHKEAGQQIALHLSENLRSSQVQLARIALSPNSQSQLIDLLLDWAERQGQISENVARLRIPLTHQQIGNLIGLSRETISRLLSQFRKQGLIHTKGTSITLHDVAKLRELNR